MDRMDRISNLLDDWFSTAKDASEPRADCAEALREIEARKALAWEIAYGDGPD